MGINLIDDSIGMAMAALGIYSHQDVYNIAVLAGKMAKMCLQFYLEGVMFQYYGEDGRPPSEIS